ncbi:hypothetical protein BDV96DRAFT_595443 [Lophiotrema nucula]|uniref:Uncharacterized protein n=1 Tax=Lophiotrema nucula TaxID=690887 RepID=A0A6A5ZKE1_9PLEO|nr:hypothetical protein BDV96DRAFT_595443 [Lophiotrema nucula]
MATFLENDRRHPPKNQEHMSNQSPELSLNAWPSQETPVRRPDNDTSWRGKTVYEQRDKEEQCRIIMLNAFKIDWELSARKLDREGDGEDDTCNFDDWRDCFVKRSKEIYSAAGCSTDRMRWLKESKNYGQVEFEDEGLKLGADGESTERGEHETTHRSSSFSLWNWATCTCHLSPVGPSAYAERRYIAPGHWWRKQLKRGVEPAACDRLYPDQLSTRLFASLSSSVHSENSSRHHEFGIM